MRTPLASGMAAAALGLLLSGPALRSWQLVLLALPPILALPRPRAVPRSARARRRRRGRRARRAPRRRPRDGRPPAGEAWSETNSSLVRSSPFPPDRRGHGFLGGPGVRGRRRGPSDQLESV